MKIALLTCSRAQHLVRIRPFLAHASSNGADGISDIEGKAAREAASECGQRASFNGANGMSDPAAAGLRREAVSERSRGDASDIEHMRSGIAGVDGNAARAAGASTGRCE